MVDVRLGIGDVQRQQTRECVRMPNDDDRAGVQMGCIVMGNDLMLSKRGIMGVGEAGRI